MPNIKKIRGLNLAGTPWATSAYCGRPLPFYDKHWVAWNMYRSEINTLKECVKLVTNRNNNSENHGHMTMYNFNVKPITFWEANKLCLKLVPAVYQPWVSVAYSYWISIIKSEFQYDVAGSGDCYLSGEDSIQLCLKLYDVSGLSSKFCCCNGVNTDTQHCFNNILMTVHHI